MSETRIDRNIIENILDLRQFKEDSSVIKMLIFYFAWKFQNKELFNVETLDVEEFCRVFSLKRENMVAKHPHPKHIERLTKHKLEERLKRQHEEPDNLEVRLFDSIVENALYRLYTENLAFSGETKYYKSADGDMNVVYPLERIIFLSTLQARHITTKSKRKKIVYDYTLNDDFKKNLSLYFSNINLNHFIALRKSMSEDLYIYLKNLRDTLFSRNENSTDTVQFEYLCEIANIRIKSAPDRKKKLIAKFRQLSASLNFPIELSFKVQSGHRWAYSPVITFPLNATATDGAKSMRTAQRQDILLNNFYIECTNIIKLHWPKRAPLSKDFIVDIIEFCKSDALPEQKQAAYLEAQKKSFIKPDPRFISKENVSSIPQRLQAIKSEEDLIRVLTSIVMTASTEKK